MQGRYYTTKEAAEILRLSEKTGDRTIRKYIYEGWLDGVKVSGVWFVDKKSVEKRAQKLLD